MTSSSDYPSIISQGGSADRNYPPILEALRPWVESAITSTSTSVLPSSSSSSRTRARIFEIGSYPYTHICRFAREFKDVHWYGSGRDQAEVDDINRALDLDTAKEDNLHRPLILDIANDEHWTALRDYANAPTEFRGFNGVVMFNVVHCCPLGYPEKVFQQLATSDTSSNLARAQTEPTTAGSILGPAGWVAVYGPFLNDDGSYKSEADREFDQSYIRSKDARLGLRSVESISQMARRNGFEEVERRGMPKGNVWVVWRRADRAGE